MACIFLDHHSTTPLDPRVLAAMCEAPLGNASSAHVYGKEAARIVELARADIAAAIGAQPGEIILLSGATEADNLALKGVMEAQMARGLGLRHLVTCAIEHSAVLETARYLAAERGCRLTILPVSPDGLVDPAAVAAAIAPDTALVSIMAVNNEVGTVQPVAEIGRICREKGVLYHSDACQAVGKVPFDVISMDVDLASLSGHKIYALPGVGALYVRQGTPLAKQMHGGTHEGGRRAGTTAVCSIIGFGVACQILQVEGPAEVARIAALRDRLLAILRAGLPPAVLHVNGTMEPGRRHPGNLNVTLVGVCSEALDKAIRNFVAVSASSACKSQVPGAGSHVLTAMGAPDSDKGAVIRFGIGRFNTPDEIEAVGRKIVEAAVPLVGIGCAIPRRARK
jgi:cysteine desulfurase